jgi:hypothetical protein
MTAFDLPCIEVHQNLIKKQLFKKHGVSPLKCLLDLVLVL